MKSERSKAKKGLLEVISSQITPKINRTATDEHRKVSRRLICSLSKGRGELNMEKKIRRIKIIHSKQIFNP